MKPEIQDIITFDLETLNGKLLEQADRVIDIEVVDEETYYRTAKNWLVHGNEIKKVEKEP